MLLARIVETSQTVAATRSRKAKVVALAETLGEAETGDLEVVTSYLGGALLQRRTGVGWRGIGSPPEPADEPSLTVAEVHAAFDHLAGLSGPGSQTARAAAVKDLLGRATAAEQAWLRGVITGNVRQGALDALVQEGLAAASGAPLKAVRRAAMLAGGTVPIARAAFEGEDALGEIGLEVGRPVLPMLASSAPDVAAAMAKAGGLGVHRHQARRHPDPGAQGRRRRRHRYSVVGRDHRPTARGGRGGARAAGVAAGPRRRGPRAGRRRPAAPVPGDRVAYRHGWRGEGHAVLLRPPAPRRHNLLDRPGTERWAALAALVPAEHRTPSVTTSDPAEAEEFVQKALELGHEGVVVKSVDAPYDAGRRGSAWVKVKPVHTLDLVVLAVEWGSGRREGWLSNIHLGARADNGDGFVMLGKTFKGMTDEMLAWQTERFTDLAVDPDSIKDHYVVPVRPEQVVEIALDGIQRSTRYPGGIALRFARVVRYRDDKSPAEADTLAMVKEMFGG